MFSLNRRLIEKLGIFSWLFLVSGVGGGMMAQVETDEASLNQSFQDFCQSDSFYLAEKELLVINYGDFQDDFKAKVAEKKGWEIEDVFYKRYEGTVYPVYVTGLGAKIKFSLGLFSRSFILTCTLVRSN
jgi:hypothetical protein